MATTSGARRSKTSEQVIDRIILDRFVTSQSKLDKQQVVGVISEAIQNLKATGVKVVSLMGGAASGKTTLARMLVNELSQANVAADFITTDDYVLGDRAYRRQHLEGTEPRAKYDFELMNEKIEAIRNNGDLHANIAVPTYDEPSGIATAAGEENYTHQIGKIDVLIVEGDFPEVTRPDMVIFMHVPDEQRLQNRLSRDIQRRSEADPHKVIENFNLRHETQHLPHTLPAVKNADMLLRVETSNDSWRYDVFQVKQS